MRSLEQNIPQIPQPLQQAQIEHALFSQGLDGTDEALTPKQRLDAANYLFRQDTTIENPLIEIDQVLDPYHFSTEVASEVSQEPAIRPIKEIISELKEVQKPIEVKLSYKTKSGNISKNRKTRLIEDTTRMNELFDEIAEKITRHTTDEDHIQTQVMSIARIAGLTDDNAVKLLMRTAELAEQDDRASQSIPLTPPAPNPAPKDTQLPPPAVDAERYMVLNNTINDIVVNGFKNRLLEHIENGDRPDDFLHNRNGIVSEAYSIFDKSFTDEISKIEEPTHRKVVIDNANALLQLTYEGATRHHYDIAWDMAQEEHNRNIIPVPPIVQATPDNAEDKDQAAGDEGKVAPNTASTLEEIKKMTKDAANKKYAALVTLYNEVSSKTRDESAAITAVTNLALADIKNSATDYRKGKITKIGNLSFLETAGGMSQEMAYQAFLENVKHRHDDKYFNALTKDQQDLENAKKEKAVTIDLREFQKISNRAEKGMRLGNAFRSLRGEIARSK